MKFSNSKISLAALVFSVGVIAFFAFAVNGSNTLSIDKVLTSTIKGLFSESWNGFFTMVSGSNWPIMISAITVLFFLWTRKRDYHGMAIVVLVVLLSKQTSEILKEWIGRERPEGAVFVEAETLSFPSGHSTVGAALFALIIYFISREITSLAGKWAAACFFALVILLIGVSRVALGAHYPSDVIAGYAVGFIFTYLGIALYETRLFRSTIIKREEELPFE